jgi:glutathione S-transferase
LKLFFTRNPNPRLAVAVAKYLDANVDFEFATPQAPEQIERFRSLNPNLVLPILADGGESLWEADAIACRLSRDAGSQFWRTGDDEPDMIRWLSWGKETFVAACDVVHFERGTKQRYGIGPIDQRKVDEGLALFHSSSKILELVLTTRNWLCGASVSYADFRMATYLPFTHAARLPLSEYPAIHGWYGRLEEIEAWRDPFRGLEAPPLPPVPQI